MTLGVTSGGAQARAYNGVLTVAYTGTPGGTPDAGCTNNVQWPAVDDIEILGVGPVNVSSVTVTVRPCWSRSRRDPKVHQVQINM